LTVDGTATYNRTGGETAFLDKSGVDVSITIQCASCGKAYRVKDELAGRKAKCACGASIAIPKPGAAKAAVPAKPASSSKRSVAAAPAAPAKATESFLDEELADATKTCPSCKAKVKFDAVLCVGCGYNFRERRKEVGHVTESEAKPSGSKCKKCGSPNTRKVSDNEFEAYTDRKETKVTIGRPLICNSCGHMWEPPASLANYVTSYARSVAFFVAGTAIVVAVCFAMWSVTAAAIPGEDEAGVVHVSGGRMARALRMNYFALGVVVFGLSLAGAGLWGILRTLIVQMGWKGILYDPDEQKW
jgi:hypothetical protein